jgi:hypothetical protein
MESGMFTARCPSCHGPLEIQGDGDGHCPHCGTTFVQRFGWLVPRREVEGSQTAGPM